MSSVIAAGLAFGVVRLLSDATPLLCLFLGSGVYLLAYLFLAPVMGAVDERDIENLDSMLRGLVVVYPFARLLLGFVRGMIRLTMRVKENL